MKNKTRNKFSGLLCLLLLALLPASCIQDDFAGKNKATVKVTFTTRAVTTSTTSGNELLPNERMQSLRVIVANGDNILYNVYYDEFEQDAYGRYYKTITFSELTTVKGSILDFYAIANESGLGSGTDLGKVTIDELKENKLNEIFLTNANAENSNTLIPQTAYKPITISPTEGNRIQEESMELDFVVAKVRLTINNTTAVEQTVQDIKIFNAKVDETFLLSRGNLQTSENPLVLSSMKIPEESTVSTWCYIYEYTRKDGFYMSALWPDATRQQTITESSITDVPRGTELDINVNLSVNTEPKVNVQVVSWTTKEMDVPAFQ